VDRLKQYKDVTGELLLDFSSLVPQWGKINPIVEYNCLLHINTPEESEKNRQELAGVVKKVLAD
jgi:hypothetical protein